MQHSANDTSATHRALSLIKDIGSDRESALACAMRILELSPNAPDWAVQLGVRLELAPKRVTRRDQRVAMAA